MERSLRQIDPAVHLTDEVTLAALGQTVSREQIEQVLKPLGIATCRKRKLTFVLVVLLCIAMCLYTEEAIDDVFVKLMQGPRFLRPAEDIVGAGQSAICQRRRQLGVVPMTRLFQQVCQPLTTPETPEAFLFGLRLMARKKIWQTHLPMDVTLAVRWAAAGTGPFHKCKPFICVSVGAMRFAMLVFGLATLRNMWAVCACCVRWGRVCW